MKVLLFVLLSFALSAQQTVKVLKVQDGDTYYVQTLNKKEVFIVRLANVDCPEIFNKHTGKVAQPYGDIVRDTVAKLMLGKIVRVKVLSTDKYLRKICTVKLPNGKDLGTFLVKNGYAWSYFDYQKDLKNKVKFDKYQAKAMKSKLNIFSDPNAMSPSEYRKIKQ